jgi:cytochrome c oxidase subunit II
VTGSHELYSGLQSLYLPIAAAVVVLFVLVVLFAAVRYRRRGDDLPGQRDESKAEYVYIGILTLIAAFLVGATYRTENDTDARGSTHPGVRVQVTAARWNWRFTYPDYGITVTSPRLPTLVVPTGEEVAFTGTAQDVIHSFWVPDMRFKHDVFPGATTHWHLTFLKRQLAISGECAEYCGLLHADMRFMVDAVPPDEFHRWVLRRQRGQRGSA